MVDVTAVQTECSDRGDGVTSARWDNPTAEEEQRAITLSVCRESIVHLQKTTQLHCVPLHHWHICRFGRFCDAVAKTNEVLRIHSALIKWDFPACGYFHSHAIFAVCTFELIFFYLKTKYVYCAKGKYQIRLSLWTDCNIVTVIVQLFIEIIANLSRIHVNMYVFTIMWTLHFTLHIMNSSYKIQQSVNAWRGADVSACRLSHHLWSFDKKWNQQFHQQRDPGAPHRGGDCPGPPLTQYWHMGNRRICHCQSKGKRQSTYA